ncbi:MULTISPECIES: LamB/YcsF family protein [unclassified Agrococcus]|uniref:LamB/YcsF family protein n=1 Tax=unclassified Agrococcus TaxID=2615065 RepID=UPI0036141FB2
MRIDLNSDVGESFGQWRLGDDAAMLELVSSANVACGFHAGDASTARRVARLAAANGVAVGAHVAYRDLAGFGRRFVDADPGELADEVLYQVGALQAIARAEGTSVTYVKPHGALYNAIVHHERQAAAVLDGVQAAGDLAIVGLPGSVVLDLAAARGMRIVREGFADRAYLPDGTLMPRTREGSVLHDADAVAAQALRMATAGEVLADDGSIVAHAVDSICVHGDTPGAVALARAVRTALDAGSIAVGPVTPA